MSVNPSDTPLGDIREEWPIVESTRVHKQWVVDILSDTVHAPGEPTPTFNRLSIHHPGAVVVLAVDEQEQVVCLRQYRHTSRHAFVELPAGIRDAEGEPPVETAKRELREEVELEAGEWRHLLSTFASAGLTDEVHEIFLARDLRHAPRGDFALEHEEAFMEVFRVPMAELLESVLQGRVRQGPLVQAVLAYQVLGARGEL